MQRKFQFLSIILVLLLCSIIFNPSTGSVPSQNISILNKRESTKPLTSTGDNLDLLDSLFNSKLLEYYNLGYFPQRYEPSLQATYYALYILNVIDKLDYINQTEISNYIMAHYDSSSFLFIDTFAYRYLDTDFSLTYYPISSLLEVNCYAVLSLEILDNLNLIDNQKMIDFIWDCQSPTSGGFIGQEYDSGLDDGFKITTADNTYFAVRTLNLLMSDWSGYSIEKDNIIQFINDLQLSGGGFQNDEDGSLDSLFPLFEPNLLSSYYCIKTLELFGMGSIINIPNFNQFLLSLYETNYFRMSDLSISINTTNIVATSLGLELSDITNNTGINRENVVTFILNNRNSLGNWDQSTTVTLHELIDTFQIIRSLNNTDEISKLSLENRNEIGNATLKYQSYRGFSLLSDDYTSMDLIHSTVVSFDLFDRLSDLDIQSLYTQIKNSYNDFADFGISRFFYGYIIDNTQIYGFRSYPIEYYSTGHNNYIQEFSRLYSHKSTYSALVTLQNIFKLDDFALEYNLMYMINDIIATQFLNDSYYNKFGAFSHLIKYNSNFSEILNKMIYFEYSFYAIRCLEILANQLSLNLLDLNFDIDALYTYIDRNIVETPTSLYFDPKYTSNVEKILENTYYMIYILKALNMYTRDNNKIKNYVVSNLDYTNIKNIYYSYKISELLSLDVAFDIHLIHDFISYIYSEDLFDFFLTSERNRIDQDIFLWICDMARNSQIGIEAYYSDVCPLGGVNHMEALLYNLILKDFGTYITFKFESNQVGTYSFSKLANNTYVQDIAIPLSSECYPVIEGYLQAYEGAKLRAESYVSFYTNYTLDYSVEFSSDLTGVSFEINTSIFTNGQTFPLSSGKLFTKIYRNGELIREVQATHQEFSNYSVFNINYTPHIKSQYTFELYIDDGISGSEINIKNVSLSFNEISETFEDQITNAIPLMVIFIAVPGTVIVFSSKQLHKSKKNS
jgi:prenyltransferase beta subunit